ncbi:MAG: tryptophan 7-halogenase [Xanthomonadales bacterium]|nr:tryptophan 7-halogenase [Xanthomonadales bacterium]
MPNSATTASSNKYDIVIIGGGPAGTTAASLLAHKGWDVLLLEKDSHPRFHIGESLLPMTLPILDELGVLDKINAIGIPKYGAEFNSSTHSNSKETFYFSDAWDKSHPSALEVVRSKFDEILFRNTASFNVDARENCKVIAIDFPDSQSTELNFIDESGEHRLVSAKFLIDASGRETFLSKKLKLKQKSKKHNTAAIFGHFTNVERREGKDAGNISIYWFKHGWFWMIPLQNDLMSIGAVCYPEYLKKRHQSVEKFFHTTVDLVPEVRERMINAEAAGKIRATGNFTYNSSRMYGDKGENYLLLGDAYAFIDPVFSSGVQIAMSGGKLAADAVDTLLRDPSLNRKPLKDYEKKISKALKTFSWLIIRFNSPAMQKLFMAPGNQFRIKEALISLLAGDLYRNTPIGSRLLLFKFIYYLTFFGNFPKAWANYRRRKRNVPNIFQGGTTAQDRQESKEDITD